VRGAWVTAISGCHFVAWGPFTFLPPSPGDQNDNVPNDDDNLVDDQLGEAPSGIAAANSGAAGGPAHAAGWVDGGPQSMDESISDEESKEQTGDCALSPFDSHRLTSYPEPPLASMASADQQRTVGATSTSAVALMEGAADVEGPSSRSNQVRTRSCVRSVWHEGRATR